MIRNEWAPTHKHTLQDAGGFGRYEHLHTQFDNKTVRVNEFHLWAGSSLERGWGAQTCGRTSGWSCFSFVLQWLTIAPWGTNWYYKSRTYSTFKDAARLSSTHTHRHNSHILILTLSVIHTVSEGSSSQCNRLSSCSLYKVWQPSQWAVRAQAEVTGVLRALSTTTITI